MVVQKPKWQKPGKDKVFTPANDSGHILPESIRAGVVTSCSRFGILGNNATIQEELIQNDQGCDLGEILVKVIATDVVLMGDSVSASDTQGKNKGKKQGSYAEINARDNKPSGVPKVNPTTTATVGTRFPQKAATQENVILDPDHVIDNHTALTRQLPLRGTTGPSKNVKLDHNSLMDQPGPTLYHSTRPPDLTTPGTSHTPVVLRNSIVDTGMVDADEFMDAHDHGNLSGDEFAMEVVMETPISCSL